MNKGEKNPLQNERKLVVNVLDALNLTWRKPPPHLISEAIAQNRQIRRECCPFVEISLLDKDTKKVVDQLHFQTKREKCKEDVHDKQNKSKNSDKNEMTIQEQRNCQPITGASAFWNETFTFNPRAGFFWEDIELRLRCWDRDFLFDTPLGEIILPLFDKPYTIGSENRQYHNLSKFGKKHSKKLKQKELRKKTKKSGDHEQALDPRNSKNCPKLLVGFRFGRVEEKVATEPLNLSIPVLTKKKSQRMKVGSNKKVPRPGELPTAAPGLVGYFPAMLQSKEVAQVPTTPKKILFRGQSNGEELIEDIQKRGNILKDKEGKINRRRFGSRAGGSEKVMVGEDSVSTEMRSPTKVTLIEPLDNKASRTDFLSLDVNISDAPDKHRVEDEQEDEEEEEEETAHKVDPVSRSRHIWNFAETLNLARKKFLERNESGQTREGDSTATSTATSTTTSTATSAATSRLNSPFLPTNGDSGFNDGVVVTDGLLEEEEEEIKAKLASDKRLKKGIDRQNKKIERKINANLPDELVLLLQMIKMDTQESNKEQDHRTKNTPKSTSSKSNSFSEEAKNNDLTTLTLRRTPLNVFAIPFFAAITENSAESVLGLVAAGETYSSSSLCQFVEISQSLQDLNLNDNGDMGDLAAKGLAQALKDSKLLKLGLARCGIKAKGCELLAQSLQANQHLRYLNLDGNAVGPDGGAALGLSLKYNCQLEELRLAENHLVLYDLPNQRHQFQALQQFTEALRFNQSLKTLGLARNSICGVDFHGRGELDPTAATAFALAMKLNAGLKTIHLEGNPGVESLKKTFTSNAMGVDVVYSVKKKRW